MKLLTSPISKHNRYSHNYQSNIYHIEYNLVQQNTSENSRIDEYSENKATYINIQEIY
jgi:heme-binding NEAT domain protein